MKIESASLIWYLWKFVLVQTRIKQLLSYLVKLEKQFIFQFASWNIDTEYLIFSNSVLVTAGKNLPLILSMEYCSATEKLTDLLQEDFQFTTRSITLIQRRLHEILKPLFYHLSSYQSNLRNTVTRLSMFEINEKATTISTICWNIANIYLKLINKFS